jgi:hypothetical protein
MNPNRYIPHPEAERGRANALLLIILAFTAVSFTLVAGTTAKFKDGTKQDRSCVGFGSIRTKKDAAGGMICERPYLVKRICSTCKSGQNDCNGCEEGCEEGARMQTGNYVAPTITITNTTEVNRGGKLEAAYEKIISAALNKDGSTTYVYTVTGKGEPQCVFPSN